MFRLMSINAVYLGVKMRGAYLNDGSHRAGGVLPNIHSVLLPKKSGGKGPSVSQEF